MGFVTPRWLNYGQLITDSKNPEANSSGVTRGKLKPGLPTLLIFSASIFFRLCKVHNSHGKSVWASIVLASFAESHSEERKGRFSHLDKITFILQAQFLPESSWRRQVSGSLKALEMDFMIAVLVRVIDANKSCGIVSEWKSALENGVQE